MCWGLHSSTPLAKIGNLRGFPFLPARTARSYAPLPFRLFKRHMHRQLPSMYANTVPVHACRFAFPIDQIYLCLTPKSASTLPNLGNHNDWNMIIFVWIGRIKPIELKKSQSRVAIAAYSLHPASISGLHLAYI
jgi:hypothetical protein